MNACNEVRQDSNEEVCARDLADHVDHICGLVGSFDHVCYGFDFCDEFREGFSAS